MINENEFENSLICQSKIKEIVNKSSRIIGNVIAYRGIRHEKNDSLVKEDFLPTIMEINDNEMPSNEVQERKTKIESFGMSLFYDPNIMINVFNSVPSMRGKFKAYAVGKLLESKGTIGEPDSTTHFQMYLFDPINLNVVSEFKYYEKEEKNDETD